MTENTQTQNQELTETQSHLAPVVQRENEEYIIVKDENGKYSRKAKFKNFSSVTATTREEKMWLLGVMEGDDESGNGLKDHVGKTIEVQNVITRTYDRINEETGELEYGVLTYLITPKKEVFATSSKSVYFSITRIMELFGKPNTPEWQNVKVKVGKEKGQNGDIIKIKMVG